VTNRSYRRKFKADVGNVAQRIKGVLRELGRDEGEISDEEIETFCKHAGFLKVIRYRSLEEEYTSPRVKFIRIPIRFLPGLNFVEGEFENTFPPTLIHYYLALRAYDRFLQVYSRPPGLSEAVQDDLITMSSLVHEILNESPANSEMVANACSEMLFPPK